jgi:hypothetical protein
MTLPLLSRLTLLLGGPDVAVGSEGAAKEGEAKATVPSTAARAAVRRREFLTIDMMLILERVKRVCGIIGGCR